LQAQARAIEGDLDGALALIDRARTGFLAAGAPLDALRTELGRMHVLNERGDQEEAITTGARALAALDDPAARSHADGRRLQMLRAKVHQNLSVCHAFAGRYARAAQEGALAETAYRAAGLEDEVASLHQNLGEQLLEVGRADEARALLQQATEEFRATGRSLFEARCHVGVGRAGMLLGHWTEALEEFARARALLEELDVRADLDQVLLRTGEAWLALGLHEEALVAYAEVEPSLRRAGQTFYLAQLLTGTGSALARAGRHDEAERALSEAAELHRSSGNVPLLSQVLLEIADVHDRRGRKADARAVAATAVDLLAGGEWLVQRVYAHLRAADLSHPDLDRVDRHLARARTLLVPLGLAPLTFRVDARQGRLRRLQGDLAEGRRLLHGACATVEALRASLPTMSLRTSFLRDAAASYTELVALELDAGDVPAAFTAADRSKSRALLDQLSVVRGPQRTGAGGDGEAGRSSHEQELLAVYSELLRDVDPSTGPVRAQRAALLDRAATLEPLVRAEHVRNAGPGASPVAGTLELAELQRRLPEAVLVLAYHVMDDGELVCFLLTADGLRAVRGVSRLSTLQPLVRRLDAQWGRFASGASFTSRHGDPLLRGTRAVLQALHRELVAPLGPLPAGARLVVVPHGPLHEVPFAALFDGEHHLLEDHEISVSPSTSVLGAALETSAANGPPLVLGAADTDAPHMEDEARAVAATLPDARLRIEGEATYSTLAREAPGSAVVHLACHGLYRPDSPLFSSLHLADGWVTAARFMQLDLSGALVTLSGCETGRTPSAGGGHEVLGLAHAALAAGARGVLVSLWLLQDETAARLVSRWYELLVAGHRRGEALRRAQLELSVDEPHPYYWAPLVLVGGV